MSLDLRKDEARYETNPFILELKGKMYLQPKANTIIAKGQEIIDTITGEVIQDSVLIGRRKIVDKSQFAKIYYEGVSMMIGISKPAMNVLVYIMTKMDFEQKVYINTEKDSEKVGYKSPVSVLKGLKELINLGVIAKASMPSWYWINPIYICKGERFAIYTEYVTSERHEKDMKFRITPEKQIVQQGIEKIESLDEKTKNQINAMNKAEEKKYYNSISFEDSEYK